MPTLSRRHLVTSAAALPALAVPAIANTLAHEPDPIFAVIAAHRGVWEDLGQCSDLDWTMSHGKTEAIRQEAARQYAQLSEAADNARDLLIDTAPTTNAGAAALLEYAADHVIENGTNCWPDDDYCNGETWVMTLHRSVAKALRTIAREAVRS
jgi:hypothetical protein